MVRSQRAAIPRQNPRINTEQSLIDPGMAQSQQAPVDEADNSINGSLGPILELGEPEPDVEPQLADIHINYLFHVIQAANHPPSNPRTRKKKGSTFWCL
ncbi:hypothetical protein Pst134EA_003083 [Puccinia striiformis f. sp. tritici]|uniref:hypothetical protein n=1 Tax=Puccinia striiformis f. sp. tritici TaxID=168172 RepID=UPI0020089D91|nr:hypothetical protein Pst134EA_003083 [Puccinia striiformis f. sp. tritici]KAH9472473.1 hypothetical protein Pst134EA_003083 [Puccinia striiformis f. sp. tritici]